MQSVFKLAQILIYKVALARNESRMFSRTLNLLSSTYSWSLVTTRKRNKTKYAKICFFFLKNTLFFSFEKLAPREELSSAHFQLVFWLHSDIFTSIHGIQPRDAETEKKHASFIWVSSKNRSDRPPPQESLNFWEALSEV